jgi:hypothetical protein
MVTKVSTYRESGVRFEEFAKVYTVFALLVAAAILFAERAPALNLYRTIYTIWATTVLLTPALCLYLLRQISPTAYSYWLLFWTFSYLAYLVHFVWAVFIIFGGFRETFTGQGAIIAGTNFLLTAWWGLDVVLAWLAPEKGWIKWERLGVHLFTFAVFAVTLLYLKDGRIRILGTILAASVIVSLLYFLLTYSRKPDMTAPAPSP